MPETTYCPQFQTRMESIPLRTTKTYLPLRRCLLAERMIAQLRTAPAAMPVIAALVKEPEEMESSEDVSPYSLYGPDLDAIEHERCTGQRCAASCTPAYRRILAQFGLEDSEPIDCGLSQSAPDAAKRSGQ